MDVDSTASHRRTGLLEEHQNNGSPAASTTVDRTKAYAHTFIRWPSLVLAGGGIAAFWISLFLEHAPKSGGGGGGGGGGSGGSGGGGGPNGHPFNLQLVALCGLMIAALSASAAELLGSASTPWAWPYKRVLLGRRKFTHTRVDLALALLVLSAVAFWYVVSVVPSLQTIMNPPPPLLRPPSSMGEVSRAFVSETASPGDRPH